MKKEKREWLYHEVICWRSRYKLTSFAFDILIALGLIVTIILIVIFFRR